ncbi:chromosome transmission fidelity protein 8 [Cyathus striatus]|nr:chromosome transmission fidelity protein 8 [Cyathus striatus]
MIIPISLSTDSTTKLPSTLARISHDEVVLVELQGILDVECNHPSERNGQFVGKLALDEGLTKPTLRIGHHLLEGKIATLAKPLAILQRPNAPPKDPHEAPLDEHMEGQTESRPTWAIIGVVKKKIIFSKRPMHI